MEEYRTPESETAAEPDALAPAGTAGEDAPAEGSDAAASLDFGRNLARLREARGLSHNRLAAGADIAADSIRDYELGKYRPKQPKLWSLAQALDVMPVSLGPGSTRGGDPPVPTELLLRKKGSRSLRLQHLVELLSPEGLVSGFAQLVGLEPEQVYAIAANEGQLSEDLLEPFLSALPRVRRSWLMSGEGEPMLPAPVAVPVAVASPEPSAPSIPGPASPASVPSVPASPQGLASFSPERPYADFPEPAQLTVRAALSPLLHPALAGAPLYVPLGAGLVAEVDAGLLDGAGAVSGFRLLAGAGASPMLSSPEQLQRLFHALSGILDQRVPEQRADA